MQRVIVIGCPGAGKSTFARKLRDRTGLPLHYLDMLWHRPNRTTISQKEFEAQLNKLIEQDRWIIDGNYQRTLELRLNVCDTVFLMDFPLEVCLAGVTSRIGKKREDLPWVETELDQEFKQWIMNFPTNELPQIYELLEKYQNGKTILIFRSRGEADNYLNTCNHIDPSFHSCYTA